MTDLVEDHGGAPSKQGVNPAKDSEIARGQERVDMVAGLPLGDHDERVGILCFLEDLSVGAAGGLTHLDQELIDSAQDLSAACVAEHGNGAT